MQPPTTTHNHQQPPKNYPKNPKLITNSCVAALEMLILKDVDFDSDMKQWHIYMRVSVYILYKSLYLLFFG